VSKATDASYPIVLRPLHEDEGGGWLAEIPDLPGCISDGETPEEAVHNVLEAQKAWLAVARERGRDIPEPTQMSEDYSGKFTLRLPKSLHRQLSLRAQMEGVSLNQLILHLISYGLGLSVARPSPRSVAKQVLLESLQEWWAGESLVHRLRLRQGGLMSTTTSSDWKSIGFGLTSVLVRARGTDWREG